MNLYSESLKLILRNEGGYVNDPSDKGGETYAGISRVFEPQWEGWHIIDEVKKKKTIKLNEKLNEISNESIGTIYKKNYWDKCNADGIATCNAKLAIHIFDMSVNAGIKTAGKLLQRILKISDDGIIGNGTLEAIKNYPDKNDLVRKYVEARKNYYTAIATGSNAKFLKGWLIRLENTVISANSIATML